MGGGGIGLVNGKGLSEDEDEDEDGGCSKGNRKGVKEGVGFWGELGADEAVGGGQKDFQGRAGRNRLIQRQINVSPRKSTDFTKSF